MLDEGFDKIVGLMKKALDAKKDDSAFNDAFRVKLDRMREALAAGVPQQITMGRGDQAVQRLLSSSSKALALWQSLPIVHFLNGEQCMDLWPHPPKNDALSRNEKWEQLCVEAMENMIWEHFIFYWVEPDTKLRCWARVRLWPETWDEYEKDPITQVFKSLDRDNVLDRGSFKFVADAKSKETLLLVDFFVQSVETGVRMSQWFIDRTGPLKTLNAAMPNDKDSKRERQEKMYTTKLTHDVHVLYAYLCQGSERTVEVRPANPKVPQGSTKAKKQPWRRDDLPHIVLLDPTKAETVGWRPTVRSGEALRKSPRPHDRRGHRRTLKAIAGVREAKQIWVRPSWIGPTDWEHKGRIYKVVQDRKVDCESDEGVEDHPQSS